MIPVQELIVILDKYDLGHFTDECVGQFRDFIIREYMDFIDQLLEDSTGEEPVYTPSGVRVVSIRKVNALSEEFSHNFGYSWVHYYDA